jgi:hypothetical protein
VGKMYWKSFILIDGVDPELLHQLLVLLHALPCAASFGHGILWRRTSDYIYFRRRGLVKIGLGIMLGAVKINQIVYEFKI